MKLAVCFLLFWLKNETGCGFMIFKGLKLWNRPKSVGKKMKLTAAAQPRAVSFIFFPDRLWRFHNFMPLKIMKPSASFIFDAKIIRKQYRQFYKVFTWNCGTIKNKNKDGFCWNLIFSIKQGNKSRLYTVISFATLTTIPQYFRSDHWNHNGIWFRKNKTLGLHKCCGKKKIGSYYGDFGKWSKRVFRVSFWWNSDFLADFFPKVYCVLTISLIIFAVIKILVAVSCSCMPCTRRNLKYCEIIFHF